MLVFLEHTQVTDGASVFNNFTVAYETMEMLLRNE